MRVRPLVIGLLALASVGACTGTPQPTVTPAPSVRASTVQEGALPPGCQPIDLASSDGERIDLDGTWREDAVEEADPRTWWIRDLGDCVWGAGATDEVPDGALGLLSIQTFAGTIGSDYTIEGEILLLGPQGDGFGSGNPIYAPIRFLIEFDDAGEVTLHEDREPGAEGPRCLDPSIFCLSPLLLRRID